MAVGMGDGAAGVGGMGGRETEAAGSGWAGPGAWQAAGGIAGLWSVDGGRTRTLVYASTSY